MDLEQVENLQSYRQIGNSSLYLAKMLVDCEFSHSHSESSLLETIFKILNKNFDFILIDSPAATSCPDALILSRSVDGLVFIVEAEKYRWQVIEKAKQNILSQGGNILGVILNKRRYPIPDFIYNKI
jgi:Mrp family chromosome partitioning ATPase